MLHTETAVGYLIATLKEMGLSNEKIDKVACEMEEQFSNINSDEADKYYYNWAGIER